MTQRADAIVFLGETMPLPGQEGARRQVKFRCNLQEFELIENREHEIGQTLLQSSYFLRDRYADEPADQDFGLGE